MDAEQIKRTDFPGAAHGYDRASVDAHLAAVAAQVAALEARITSFEVERDALRREIAADAGPAEVEVISEAAAPAEPRPRPSSSKAEDEVSARLIATKMALDGTDRETIRVRLAGEYELEDLDALLDDVIERVG
ncbi:MAG TPA: hypothetical protein VMF31_01570 [Solirubrobacterales bacterium]|nr:hypothetical protein [Solirubrobacterales bacterium]